MAKIFPGKYQLEFLEFIDTAGVKADITDLFIELDSNCAISNFSNDISISISDAQNMISKLNTRIELTITRSVKI